MRFVAAIFPSSSDFFRWSRSTQKLPGASLGARLWKLISESVTPFALQSAEARGTLPKTPSRSDRTKAWNWQFGGVQQKQELGLAAQPGQARQVPPEPAQVPGPGPALLAQSVPAPLLQELVRGPQPRLFLSSW